MLAHIFTILHKACPVSFVVAFFKVFYQLARVVGTLKTIGQSFALDTIFYLAFTAVLRLSYITV